jgi:hypothetical protein
LRELMTKPLPWGGRVALLLLLPIGLLPLFATVQRTIPHGPSSRFQDWSTRHTIYSQTGTSAALEAARSDPRALFRWREVEQREAKQRQALAILGFRGRRPPHRFPNRVDASMHRDWSINLGTAGTAPSMYPAKFGFNVTSAPDCTNDFVVFPVNATGSATQPNIVAFNNLYSGTAGGTGICDGRTTPAGHTDTKTSATVLWSYNVNKIGGAVTTSPVISFDATGSKIAFVESAAGNPAHFHVLAWKSGDGQTMSLQNVLVPLAITTFVGAAPIAGSGTATDLALGAATTGTDTLSSPYIDYANDFAYVGNDIGIVYRIKNVFCTTASCGTAAPSLDTTWGTGGAVTIGGTCTGKLTAPVLDFYNLDVYVGCSDGKLYSISQGGTIKSLAVGDGVAAKTFGGIVDPPIVDGVNGLIYAVSGSANSGANGVLVQTKPDFSSSVAVPIGNGNQCNIHAPALSNGYFANPGAANSLIYVGGVTGTVGPCTAAGATGGAAVLYGATFTAGGILNAGAPAHSLVSTNPIGSEYAPMGEFFNPNIGTGEDTLFVSLLRNDTHGLNNLYAFNITTGWSAAPQTPSMTVGLGSSGSIIDNSSTSAQASSIYFNALNEDAACSSPQTGANNGGCAIKLTQAAFQ